MSAATPTGAELRAERERLGLSAHDIAVVIGSHENGVLRMEKLSALDLAAEWPVMYDAYTDALAAEEKRRRASAEPTFKVGDWVRVKTSGAVYQIGEVAGPFGGALYYRERLGARTCHSWTSSALERVPPPVPEAPAEPVPPAGVTVQRSMGVTYVRGNGATWTYSPEDEPVVRYVASLAAWDAQHAAGDRERKLAAVKAAEEALEKTYVEVRVAIRDLDDAKEREARASQAHKAAYVAHDAARKEAGL